MYVSTLKYAANANTKDQGKVMEYSNSYSDILQDNVSFNSYQNSSIDGCTKSHAQCYIFKCLVRTKSWKLFKVAPKTSCSIFLCEVTDFLFFTSNKATHEIFLATHVVKASRAFDSDNFANVEMGPLGQWKNLTLQMQKHISLSADEAWHDQAGILSCCDSADQILVSTCVQRCRGYYLYSSKNAFAAGQYFWHQMQSFLC